MTITDLVLILFIAALLAFAIYDQFIMPRRNGPTLLAIPLLRRGRIDSVIFVGLIVINPPDKKTGPKGPGSVQQSYSPSRPQA